MIILPIYETNRVSFSKVVKIIHITEGKVKKTDSVSYSCVNDTRKNIQLLNREMDTCIESDEIPGLPCRTLSPLESSKQSYGVPSNREGPSSSSRSLYDENYYDDDSYDDDDDDSIDDDEHIIPYISHIKNLVKSKQAGDSCIMQNIFLSNIDGNTSNDLKNEFRNIVVCNKKKRHKSSFFDDPNDYGIPSKLPCQRTRTGDIAITSNEINSNGKSGNNGRDIVLSNESTNIIIGDSNPSENGRISRRVRSNSKSSDDGTPSLPSRQRSTEDLCIDVSNESRQRSRRGDNQKTTLSKDTTNESNNKSDDGIPTRPRRQKSTDHLSINISNEIRRSGRRNAQDNNDTLLKEANETLEKLKEKKVEIQ